MYKRTIRIIMTGLLTAGPAASALAHGGDHTHFDIPGALLHAVAGEGHLTLALLGIAVGAALAIRGRRRSRGDSE